MARYVLVEVVGIDKRLGVVGNKVVNIRETKPYYSILDVSDGVVETYDYDGIKWFLDRGIKIDTDNVSIVREPDRRWVDAECNYGDFNIGDDVFVSRMMFRKCNSNVANISSGNNFPALIHIEIFQVGKGKVFSYDCKGDLNYPYLNRVETGVGDPDDEIINNGYDFAPYAYYEHCDERQRYEHHRADIIHRYSGSYWLDISGCYKLCSNPSNTIVLSLHEEFKGERASVHCFDKKLILKHDNNNGSFKVVKETEFTKRY